MPAADGSKHGHETVIKNRLGLHARPAAMFVREANRHKCEIHVEKDGEKILSKAVLWASSKITRSMLFSNSFQVSVVSRRFIVSIIAT